MTLWVYQFLTPYKRRLSLQTDQGGSNVEVMCVRVYYSLAMGEGFEGYGIH